jgi:hypothetical protein
VPEGTKRLILERAERIFGGRLALARALEATEHQVAFWIDGKLALPDDKLLKLADLLAERADYK